MNEIYERVRSYCEWIGSNWCGCARSVGRCVCVSRVVDLMLIWDMAGDQQPSQDIHTPCMFKSIERRCRRRGGTRETRRRKCVGVIYGEA